MILYGEKDGTVSKVRQVEKFQIAALHDILVVSSNYLATNAQSLSQNRAIIFVGISRGFSKQVKYQICSNLSFYEAEVMLG